MLQKLVTSVGTNLGKGPYSVSGCEIWQQVVLKLPERKAGWFPAGRRSGNYENRADPDATTARATRAAAIIPERCIPDYPAHGIAPCRGGKLPQAPAGLPVPCPSRTRYFCSPVMTHSPRWLWMVDATVSTPVLRCGVSAAMVSRG